MKKPIAALVLALAAAACGPPFEEGLVIGTEYLPGYYEEVCTNQYIPAPDGNGGIRNQFVGVQCRDVWRSERWRVDVAGVNEDGGREVVPAYVHLPLDSPPAREGDQFSLVEMRVVNQGG